MSEGGEKRKHGNKANLLHGGLLIKGGAESRLYYLWYLIYYAGNAGATVKQYSAIPMGTVSCTAVSNKNPREF